jgi:CheY-like chemotaxis protein
MNDRDAELTILLVEDDDVAAEAVVRSLGKAQLMFPVVWAEHGEQALGALRGQDPGARCRGRASRCWT